MKELKYISKQNAIWSGKTDIIEVRGDNKRFIFSVEFVNFESEVDYLNFIDFLILSLNKNK